MTDQIAACPACGSSCLRSAYVVSSVPVNSVLLLETRERAVSFPTGDIDLTHCEQCDFVFNARFDATMTEYSGRYESTQAFSSTFVAFTERLVDDLIERHDLKGKRILEIGCGDGDFLRTLCARGGNIGIGYDPAYEPSRHCAADGITFIQEFFTAGSSSFEADFIVCKMTLEHISDVGAFMAAVRQSIDVTPATTVFFQVPNADYVFDERAFWDVYYEHCSYFTPDSLANLFHLAGFEVDRTWTDYQDQYLMIEARPAIARGAGIEPIATGATGPAVANFAAGVHVVMDDWKARIAMLNGDGSRVAIWGAGSKAVAFLGAIGQDVHIDLAIDINPNKAGTFLPGSGLEIVAPHSLVATPPDVVVVMNPIYTTEITDDLHALGLQPEVLAL